MINMFVVERICGFKSTTKMTSVLPRNPVIPIILKKMVTTGLIVSTKLSSTSFDEHSGILLMFWKSISLECSFCCSRGSRSVVGKMKRKYTKNNLTVFLVDAWSYVMPSINTENQLKWQKNIVHIFIELGSIFNKERNVGNLKENTRFIFWFDLYTIFHKPFDLIRIGCLTLNNFR